MKYFVSALVICISTISIFGQQSSNLNQVSIGNPTVVNNGNKKAIQIDPLNYNPVKTPIDNLGASTGFEPVVIGSGAVNAASFSSGSGVVSNNPINNNLTNNNSQNNADPRNLPLSPNGKLLSVDGYEVTFKVPQSSKNGDICLTPMPTMVDGNKNPACGFIVPRDNPASRDAANTAVTKYFQLRWLVFTDGGPSSNIDQATINDLMAELNADYAAHNMIFCADPATFLESPTWYTHNSNTDEFPMKDANNVNPTQVINIYVVGTMSAGGYARMPYDPNGGTSARGGIVLARGNCSVGTHTLAHEMGHTFGLFHTFNGPSEQPTCGNCYEQVRNANGSSNSSGVPTPLGGPYTQEGDQEGDWCSDTNPHAQDSYQCPGPAGQEACDAFPRVPANYPVDNHMSYSFCTSTFTAQQGRRMHGMVEDYLSSWTAYGGGICGTQPPVADFVGTPTTWTAPSNVTFTDLSTPQNIITGWTWTFDVAGGNGVTCAGCVGPNATFNGQVPPVVTYPNVGLYTVSLTITSANGPDTETKTNYIEVVTTGSDCDTLDNDWNTPTPNPTILSGANGYFTGVPNEGSNAPADPAGFYQQYFTPNAGTSVVGAVTVGLGLLNDADDDMTFQIVVYEDDAGNPGFPDFGAGPVAVRAFSPTQIGVPTGASYNVFNIPFLCAPTIAGATFHVGVEMFPGDPTDELIVVSNADGEGGSPLTNTYTSTLCGSQDYNDVGAGSIFCASYLPVDFDLLCYPQMGWYRPTGQALGYTEDVRCDTTDVTIFTGTLYDGAGCTAPSGPNTGMVGWTYIFADGTTISSPTEVPTLNRTYYAAGPDTLTIMVSNDCGRADTSVWIIPYNFMETPDAEFTKVQSNPICMGAPGVDFNANTSGYQDYTWDFGDGTVLSSGNSPSTNHVYAATGLYYTTLTVTTLGFQPVDTFYLEDFESGWPAGYDRYSNDAFVPNAAVNPPFTGSNATAWVPMDVDGDGSTEAVSTSWHTAPGQQADDWMITTAIGPLPANQMLTWDGQALDATFSDGYEVRISNTQLPANVGNYGTLLTSVAAENAFRTTRSADLSGYAGQTVYIAFRNNSVDQYLLNIDNIRVGTIGTGCTATITKQDFVEIVDCSVIPPVADLYASDTTGCAPLTVTFIDSTTIGDPATSWVWNFGDGTFSTTQNPPPHTYTNPGTYFVSLEVCNAGGCSTDYVTVVVGTGTVADAGIDQNICGTTSTFAGNDPTPDPGNWALLSGAGTPTTPTQFNSGVTGLAAGSNLFTWTITGSGCTSVDTVEIFVELPVNAGIDDTLDICATATSTDLHTLLGGADTTGTWNGPSVLTGGYLGTFDPTTNAAGTYQYIVSGTAPCTDDTAEVLVNITANDDPTFTYPDFCSDTGGVAGVINTPGGTFSFNPDPLDGSTINPGTGAISNAVAGSTYNIQYLTPAGACQDSLTIAVNVLNCTVFTAGFTASDTSICVNNTITFTDTTTGATGWQWDFDVTGVGGAAPAIANTQGPHAVNFTATGTYTVELITTDGTNVDTATATITVTATDDATFTYPDFCSDTGGVAGLINTPGGTFSFNPDPLDGSTINPGTGAISNAVAGSTYNIQYLTPAGACQDSLTIAVNVLNCTVFTAGFTASDTSICVNNTITFTDTTTGATGWQWDFDVTGVGGAAPAIANTQGPHAVNFTATGTYTVELITTDGTNVDTATATITVTATDDATFTYPDFCSDTGGVAGLINTPGGTFSFNPDPLDGSTINPGTGAISNAVAGSTYNIQYLTPAGACQDSLTIAVNVLNCTVFTAGFTTSSTTICATDSIVFTDTTSTATIWQWDFDETGVGGAAPSTANTQGPHTVFFNTPGTYTIELIASDGTEIDTATTTITVTDCTPTANFTASQTSICEMDCITFTDLSTGSPTSYSWSFPGGTPNNAVGANPGSICYNTPGTYSVTLTVTNQYGVDSVVMTNHITVNSCPAPTAGITMDDVDGEICQNDCINFTYDGGTGGVPTTIDWTFEAGTPSTYTSTDPNEVISVCWNDTTGMFIVDVTATNANGTSSASDTVTVHYPPIVNAGLDTTINIGTDGYLNAVVTDTAGNIITGGSFLWTPASEVYCAVCPNTHVSQPLVTNTYLITYTDEYGCVVTDEVIIAVEIANNIGVPSGFSPNGDGSNDVLYVRGKIVIESMVFTVYNRYGQKVFETTDKEEGWDGTHNGKELNPGVFTYYVEATFIDGSAGKLKGNVTLVR